MSDFAEVKSHYEEMLKEIHLKDLLSEKNRSNQFILKNDHFVVDMTREKLDQNIINKFQKIFVDIIRPKIKSMQNGEFINKTEKRQVLHHLLRENFANPLTPIINSFPEIQNCFQRIQKFSQEIRLGNINAFGQKFENIISIGIGGSYLGVECVYEALKINPKYSENKENLNLYFLSNVDPACFSFLSRTINLKKTLIVVISKSYTTPETLQNSFLIADELKRLYANENDKTMEEIMKTHFCAITSNIEKCKELGIAEERLFPIWDWVGGRYSVSSAVGGLPLSLAFSFDVFKEFLEGMHWLDTLFFSNDNLVDNPAALLGFLDHFHNSVEKYSTKAIIPYSQGLVRLPAHIQQVEMESNGKKYNVEKGIIKTEDVGKFVFGEPGTNSQHSFFQLLHQGRVSPVEFIGFCNPQEEKRFISDGKDCFAEFMANMFAQADALAIGMSSDDLPRFFPGNRPSIIMLFKNSLDAFSIGIILALYEQRTAVEGFLAEINSFDQFGVELGKKLALSIRVALRGKNGLDIKKVDSPSQALIDYFNENTKID